ncbi:MAG: type IV toxin-antitoxin system AbiEi family antitoxin domain-containing protein, partial [bacterium]
MSKRQSEILAVIRKQGGSIRTSQAKAIGISPGTLYKLQESGVLEGLGRGMFRLSDIPDEGHHDLVQVAARLPQGVFCLETALHYHGLLSRTPAAVHIAVPPTTRTPGFDNLAVVVYRLTGDAFTMGVEKCRTGGVTVRCYSVEKTLADCFRFRSRVGVQTCIEALRRYCEQPGADLEKVRGYARVCHVER